MVVKATFWPWFSGSYPQTFEEVKALKSFQVVPSWLGSGKMSTIFMVLTRCGGRGGQVDVFYRATWRILYSPSTCQPNR